MQLRSTEVCLSLVLEKLPIESKKKKIKIGDGLKLNYFTTV